MQKWTYYLGDAEQCNCCGLFLSEYPWLLGTFVRNAQSINRAGMKCRRSKATDVESHVKAAPEEARYCIVQTIVFSYVSEMQILGLDLVT
jgi:hypothetical protein